MAHSELRTQVVQAFEELADDGDLGAMQDMLPLLGEMVAAVAAPDFECVMVGLPPTPPVTFPGVEGLERAWRDYGEAFETVRAELEEIREGDDHIVVLVQQRAVTRHAQVPIEQPSAMVIAFEGDRVRRIEFHLDQAEALRVAGLEP